MTRDEDLMRYMDGEMSPQEARAFERRVADSAGDKAKLESMKWVGDFVRDHAERSADAAEPRLAALWDSLDAKLGPAQPAESASTRPGATPAPAPSIWDWLRGRALGLGLASAVGAAAGALLVLTLRPPDTRVTERIVVREAPATHPAQPAGGPHYEPPVVESLEVVDRTGVVFNLPAGGSDDTASTLIWLSGDEPLDHEDPL